MKYLFFTAVISSAFFFSGCTSNGETVICPKISVPEEGARALVKADGSAQLFNVRLNGVKANCKLHTSGDISMALTVGLKLSRNLMSGAQTSFVAVPMMTATVNERQKVIANDEFGYRVIFNKGEAKKYPTVEIEQLIPTNSRLVISLKPAMQ